MKICLVTDYLPGFHETWSGAEIVCLRLSKILKKNGHNVTFITTELQKDDFPTQKIYPLQPPLSIHCTWFSIFPFNFFYFLDGVRILKEVSPDVIHFHAKILFLPLLIAAKLLDIPVVYTVLDYNIICPLNILRRPDGEICITFHGSHCFECIETKDPSKSGVKKLIRKVLYYCRALIYDYLARKLDAIITFTQTSKSRLRAYGLPADKIRVIYQYRMDLKKGSTSFSGVPFQNPTILFVGSLYEHKGLHIVIEAMKDINKKVPNTKLLVIGAGKDNQYKVKIAGIIENFGLKNRVQFFGQRENEEVMQIMDRSDVVVVPEQWPNDFGPVILVEAMASRKPVVASKIGGIPELIKDGLSGFLVAYDQPEQWAEKVVWLLQHKESARVIGENAKESVRFLYDGELAKKVIDLYHSLIIQKSKKSSGMSRIFI